VKISQLTSSPIERTIKASFIAIMNVNCFYICRTDAERHPGC
jgi:hypothetical protein